MPVINFLAEYITPYKYVNPVVDFGIVLQQQIHLNTFSIVLRPKRKIPTTPAPADAKIHYTRVNTYRYTRFISGFKRVVVS